MAQYVYAHLHPFEFKPLNLVDKFVYIFVTVGEKATLSLNSHIVACTEGSCVRDWTSIKVKVKVSLYCHFWNLSWDIRRIQRQPLSRA